jgi:hypothetical protein
VSNPLGTTIAGRSAGEQFAGRTEDEMKRMALVILVMAAFTAVGSVDAGAGSKKPRIEIATYGSAGGPELGCTYDQYRESCVPFDVMRGERFFEIALDDALGTTVSASVYQRRGPNQGLASAHDICGATDEPLRLHRTTVEILVLLYQGPCSDLTPAAATTGTVTATFSTRR